MAQKTLANILAEIGAYVDQDTTAPTGTEETVRVNLVNQALTEWGESYQWKSLRVKYAPSINLSGTSLGLPTNFKKLMSPVVDVTLDATNQYKEIRPEERFLLASDTRYCYITGDDALGKALMINPPLASGVSLVLDYQAYPSGLATLQDISVCPNPTFLAKRATSLILGARSDNRFPTLAAEADRALNQMIEEEMAPSGGEENTTHDWYQKRAFRIGE